MITFKIILPILRSDVLRTILKVSIPLLWRGRGGFPLFIIHYTLFIENSGGF